MDFCKTGTVTGTASPDCTWTMSAWSRRCRRQNDFDQRFSAGAVVRTRAPVGGGAFRAPRASLRGEGWVSRNTDRSWLGTQFRAALRSPGLHPHRSRCRDVFQGLGPGVVFSCGSSSALKTTVGCWSRGEGRARADDGKPACLRALWVHREAASETRLAMGSHGKCCCQ